MSTPRPLRRVLILGPAGHRLHGTVATLRTQDVTATLATPTTPIPDGPVEGLVIADTFAPDTDWSTWWEQEAQTWELFESVLPILAPSARGVMVGFTDTRDRRSRVKVRKGLHALIARFQATAEMTQGSDFSINAIETPTDGETQTLDHRLAEHLSHRGAPLANGIVVSIDEIRDQTLSEATSTNII